MTRRKSAPARLAMGIALTLTTLSPLAAQAQSAATNRAPVAQSARELGVEATIPFVNMGSIRNWQADGRDGLYIQDQRRNWYRATLMGPCNDLNFAERIGFETRGTSSLDRFATVIVRGQRCAFSSLVTSAAPPTRAEQRAQQAEQAEAARRNSN